MAKIGRHLREIVRRTIFIGFGIQILLGIGWMAYALVSVRAKTGSLGECALCLLRFALAWFACAYFLDSMGDGARRGSTGKVRLRKLLRLTYGGLGLASFPMAAQSCLSSDGNAVPTALLLLASSCVVRLLRSGSSQRVQRMDRILLCILAVAAGGAVLYGAVTCSQANTQENPGTWLVSRFAWSTLADAQKDWSGELVEAAEGVDILTASYYPEEMERSLVPELEEKLGTEGAVGFLRQIAAFAVKNDPVRVLKDIAWDAAGYTFSPIVAQLQLTGRAYESLTGRNYEELLRMQPYLGKLYFDYGCKWYTVLLVLTVLLWAVDRFSRKKETDKPAPIVLPEKTRADRLAGSLPWLTAAILIVYCTMRRGGLMDYRNTVYVIYLVLGRCILYSDTSVITQEQEHGEDAEKA